MLGICAWVVERRIPLHKRVLQAYHYSMPSIHSKGEPKTLVEAIRAKRIGMKMTLRQFGKIIGRHFCAVSEWERGVNRPNAESRQKLVDWLGYDPEASVS